MRFLQIGILGAGLVSSVYAADLTGRWVATTTTPDGEKRETIFALKAEGDQLTGYVSSAQQGDANISEGKISGDEISFVVLREFFDQMRKIPYTGRVTADGLLINMPGFGGRPGRETLAKRISTEAPKPLPPPPPKISLPPMKDVAPN